MTAMQPWVEPSQERSGQAGPSASGAPPGVTGPAVQLLMMGWASFEHISELNRRYVENGQAVMAATLAPALATME